VPTKNRCCCSTQATSSASMYASTLGYHGKYVDESLGSDVSQRDTIALCNSLPSLSSVGRSKIGEIA
jgi:hypothetical protein